jgi:hypothetical protein
MEQRRTATLGKFFTAVAAAQQSDMVTAVDLTDDQMTLTDLTKLLAFGVHTG